MKTDLGPDRPFPGLRPYNALEHGGASAATSRSSVYTACSIVAG